MNESHDGIQYRDMDTFNSDGKRFDRFGNEILTEIGRYSLTQKSMSKSANDMKTDRLSIKSGGTGENSQSPTKVEDGSKKKRFKISFMDDVTGDKS